MAGVGGAGGTLGATLPGGVLPGALGGQPANAGGLPSMSSAAAPGPPDNPPVSPSVMKHYIDGQGKNGGCPCPDGDDPHGMCCKQVIGYCPRPFVSTGSSKVVGPGNHVDAVAL